jgi:hypothetical protein
MKRLYFAFAAAGLLVCLAGCCTADRHHDSGCGCDCDCPKGPIAAPCSAAPCGPSPCVGRDGLQGEAVAEDEDGARRNAGAMGSGPPTGAITYPYYTNRGPRDYFDRNPQGIGP